MASEEKMQFMLFDLLEGKALSPHGNWTFNNKELSGESILYRKQENGFYQILKEDNTIYPNETSSEVLGFIPIPGLWSLFLEYHHNSNDNYTYGLVTISTESIWNKNSTSYYQSYTKNTEAKFINYSVIQSTILKLGDRPAYNIALYDGETHSIWGLNSNMISNSKNKTIGGEHYEAKNRYKEWFKNSDLNAVLELADYKWRSIKANNDQYWEAFEYEKKIAAEKSKIEDEQKQREAEYNKGLKDYRECMHEKLYYSSCNNGYWAEILGQNIMLEISDQKKAREQEEKESDTILQEALNKRNNDIYLSPEMYKKGYRVMKWNGSTWEY